MCTLEKVQETQVLCEIQCLIKITSVTTVKYQLQLIEIFDIQVLIYLAGEGEAA